MTTFNPIDGDGVQAVSVFVPGWTVLSTPDVFDYARESQTFVDDAVTYWTKFTDRIEFSFYGYDPIVYDEGEPVGTDGMPDAVGKYDEATETIIWERT